MTDRLTDLASLRASALEAQEAFRRAVLDAARHHTHQEIADAAGLSRPSITRALQRWTKGQP